MLPGAPADGLSHPEQQGGQEGSGIHLYTMCSPNGWKASVVLEELGIPYTVHKINILRGDQRSAEYLKINPVGKIPSIVDFDCGGLNIFESGAIMCHLAETRDPQHRLLPQDPKERAEVLTYLFFHTSTLVPAAQAVTMPLVLGSVSTHDQLEKGIEDLKRYMGVLDARLAAAGGWLTAGHYTLADIAHSGMVLLLKYVLGLDMEGRYPHLADWLERVMARDAVKRGMCVPDPCWLLVEGPRERTLEAIHKRAQEYGIEL